MSEQLNVILVILYQQNPLSNGKTIESTFSINVKIHSFQTHIAVSSSTMKTTEPRTWW